MKIIPPRTRRRCGAAGILAALVLGLVPLACAQNSTIGYGVYNAERTFKPEFSARDIVVIGRVLKLSPEELEVARQLHAGYVAALDEKTREVQTLVDDAIERAELVQDKAHLDPANEQIAAWNKKAEEMKKEFLADLRSLLNGDQEARWPLVDRELRRHRTLPQGRLFGESVDVLKVLDEVAPEALGQAAFAELAEQYSTELDRALVTRDNFLEQEREKFEKLRKDDPPAAERLWQDALRYRQAVRDTNDRYARLLGEVLTPELRGALEAKYFEQAHARLVKPSRAEVYLEGALDLESLDEPVRSKLEEIKTRYDQRRRAMIREQAAAERLLEASELPDDLMVTLGKRAENKRGFQGQQRLPEKHPLIGLREAQAELDRAVRLEVRGLLTPEQRARIPAHERGSMAYFADYSPRGL